MKSSNLQQWIKNILIVGVLILIRVPVNGQEFITTWQTDNPGSSANNQITIPTAGGGYDYSLVWVEIGDPGNTGSLSDVGGTVTLDLPKPGNYRITISGVFPQIYFNGGGDRRKILTVEAWGNMNWRSFRAAFRGCTNLNINASDSPNLSQVTDLSSMFRGATSLNANFNGWNTSNVTDMSMMFDGASAFNGNIGNWITSSVTDMSYMFRGASVFNRDIGAWNTANVTNMRFMFSYAVVFDQKIDSWNTGRVTNMEQMFRVASVFNQDIGSWDVSKVTNMSLMFQFAQAFNQDIGGWDTGSVIDMRSMFSVAPAFNQNINAWNVSNVQFMYDMFNGAIAFNQPLNNWNTGSVTNMRQMFSGATVFNQNLNNWDVSKVANMQSMFNSASAFNGNISNWDVSNVTNMTSMFRNAARFNQNINAWNITKVTSLAYVFSFAADFNQPLNNWDVSGVTNIESLFNWATSFNQPLNNWNTANVTSMRSAFSAAYAFNQDIGGWNTGKVIDFYNMFSFTDFNRDIGNWDVSKAQFLGNMFQYATSFNQDISKWDLASAVNMGGMFYNATAFDQPLDGWNFPNATNIINLLNQSGLSVENYDLTLIGWNSNPSLPSGLSLGADGLFYCTAQTARSELISNYGWTITDAGESCPSGEIVVYDGANTSGPQILDDQSTAIDFGYDIVGNNVTRSFTIQNQGTEVLNISGITISGTAFSITSTPPTSLNINATATFTVELSGATAGAFSETLTIASDDSDEASFDFPIQGTITASPEPELVVHNGSGAADPEIFDGQASSIFLGTTPQGTDLTYSFLVENLGSATLTISDINVTGSVFSIPINSVAIPSGDMASFSVVLDGSTIGVFSGTVTITSNDPDEGSFDFPISAEVLSPLAPKLIAFNGPDSSSPQLADGSTVNFGTTTPGEAITRTFTVNNIGDADLSISFISVTGTAFNAPTGTPIIVPVDGMEQTFDIVLTASDKGTFTETVTVISNDEDFVFTVTGTVSGNDSPEITGQSPLVTDINTPITLSVDDFTVSDSDNTFPDDFQLIVNSGENYTTDGITVTPDTDYTGLLLVPVMVSDGVDYSPEYMAEINVVAAEIELIIAGQPQLNGGTIIFNDVPVGQEQVQELVITNTGSAVLNITDISIEGDDFALLGDIPGPINPGESITLRVAFTPTSAGPKSAKMTISGENAQTFITTLSSNGLEDIPDIEVINAVTLVNSSGSIGKHDFLEIKNIQFYPDNEVYIYSRWGDEVYKTSSYDNDSNHFAGVTSGGKELADGTYYYVITVNDGTKVYNGFFLLRR
ncbi:BspA family leucine-rich repeat surface protein [Fulvivirga ligni]|uniref:BspA family leucine-rich repeat surface protein n=1 Tax=Fulvivirga ligni TaxID=2904246 RepID=UPI001F1AF05A|nr:BspA family leucine-rich repeat surface protein [Fulvivirga ligni]UII24321.1 BspA family leucine-rich repeat surface protein [Fulvivirga ligni]